MPIRPKLGKLGVEQRFELPNPQKQNLGEVENLKPQIRRYVDIQIKTLLLVAPTVLMQRTLQMVQQSESGFFGTPND